MRQACTTDFLDVTLDSSPVLGLWSIRALVATGEAGGTWLPGFKAVAVTKILHRKRPNHVPIFDSSVYQFYLGNKPVPGAYEDTPRRLWPLPASRPTPSPGLDRRLHRAHPHAWREFLSAFFERQASLSGSIWPADATYDSALLARGLCSLLH
ncbi:DUF6308 family protein [Streptomyces sp. NPDC002467]|uniref:DUF6308 family protein n=1 Tax=Streptomyces sp. NPDC002467 TaxID=3364647 RepID=UPI0036B8432B